MLKSITSAQNPLIKHLCKLKVNRDYREEHQRVFIEGLKLVKEAALHSTLHTIITTQPTLLPAGIKADQQFIVSEQIFQKISGLQSPEGIAAEISMPPYTSLNGFKRLLALDGVNDPGNLGTLLRTALALGWEGVYLLNESCDPYNEKAIRAAKGATFRLPMAQGGITQLTVLIGTNQLQPYVADIEGISLNALESQERILLILGNESHGASPAVRNICRSVTIPMSPTMESLNVAVAGGILMYTLSAAINCSEDRRSKDV